MAHLFGSTAFLYDGYEGDEDPGSGGGVTAEVPQNSM